MKAAGWLPTEPTGESDFGKLAESADFGIRVEDPGPRPALANVQHEDRRWWMWSPTVRSCRCRLHTAEQASFSLYMIRAVPSGRGDSDRSADEPVRAIAPRVCSEREATAAFVGECRLEAEEGRVEAIRQAPLAACDNRISRWSGFHTRAAR